MIKQVSDIIAGIQEGKQQISSFRKVSSQTSTAGTWVDLSMASGNPSPNFYSGVELTATTLDGNKGIYHGSDTELTKVLTDLQVITVSSGAVPITLQLCDYLLFYPQIDMDSVDEQFMDNSTTLPRYSDGVWVQMFVIAQYPYIWGAGFSVKYTNSNGVSGRNTGLIRTNTATNIASFIHSWNTTGTYGKFLPLQSGDVGVKSVESITFSSPNGWLGAIVLVKPLANITINEIKAPSETSFIKDITSIPEIKNGAYLNFICLPNGSIFSAPIIGEIRTAWN